MRLTASFSALAALAFLTMLHADWSLPPVEDSRDTDAVEISRCHSAAELHETTKYYDFFGAREQDADRSFRQRLLVSQDFNGVAQRFAGQAN